MTADNKSDGDTAIIVNDGLPDNFNCTMCKHIDLAPSGMVGKCWKKNMKHIHNPDRTWCEEGEVVPMSDKTHKGKLIKRSSRNPSNGDYECPKCHSEFYGMIEPTAYCPRCDILIEVVE